MRKTEPPRRSDQTGMTTIRNSFVLNVYKEIPWTSHDAVGRVRRILGERQVGHAGSLDPFACGVLVVAVGRATKLVQHLMELSKGYKGTFLFGRRTNTGDAAGEILEEGPVPEVDLKTVQDIAQGFLGSIQQVPPMVSALKHEGRRLYDLAREGIEVERAPRSVRVDRFTITAVELPRVDFELECGRGTYVRTLVEDLASRLKALAMIESLTRTRVGPFGVADSCRLISPPCDQAEGLIERSCSMAEAIAHLPGAMVDARWIHRLRQGGMPPMTALRFRAQPRPGETVRLLGPGGELLALAAVELVPGPADRPIEESCALTLERVF
jgi:tRNA pseudouridine55 synthase